MAKYLYNRDTGRIEIQWVQGIGSDKAAAPQARLMATVINGILNRQLPWRLVLLGVFLVISIELLGVRSLPFAVGSYLSIATTAAIFAGGCVRWLAERGRDEGEESEIGPGPLYASRLIADGGIFGLVGIVLALLQDQEFTDYHIFPAGLFQIGPKILGGMAASNAFAVVLFRMLCATPLFFARKKLE